ncbi:MAG: PAS domain S-box protein, partial [Vicinamibacteria bacterium]
MRSGLLRLAQALAVLREASAVVEVAVSVGAPLARATRSAVLVEDDQGEFRIAASAGFAEPLAHRSIAALRARLDEAVRERAPVRVESSELKGQKRARAPSFVTLLPMFHGRELMGIFHFECRASTADGLDHDAAQSVAELVAAALKNARLFESMSASESELRALSEGASDLVLTIDESGAILDANPAACRALGHSVFELSGAKLESLLVTDSVPTWRKLAPSVLRGARLHEESLKL